MPEAGTGTIQSFLKHIDWSVEQSKKTPGREYREVTIKDVYLAGKQKNWMGRTKRNTHTKHKPASISIGRSATKWRNTYHKS